MRKVSCVLLVMVMFFCFLPLASSSCRDCVGGYDIEYTIALDSVSTALDSAVGEEIVSIVEDMGGEVDVAGVRGVTFQQAEVYLIPAGENRRARFNVVYINKGEMDPFWGVIESPKEIYNLLNTYAIYLPSGDILSFEGFGTTTISDIKPSVNWDYCLYYIICDYILPSQLDLICLYFLYLCFF